MNTTHPEAPAASIWDAYPLECPKCGRTPYYCNGHSR